MSNFNKIVVIGAGTMGSGIAAHLANSNRQVVLLDLKGKDKPNQISENAIDIIKKSKLSKLGRKGKINDFDMKSPVTNFYKTCSISRASETMSLCNEKLNSKIAAE